MPAICVYNDLHEPTRIALEKFAPDAVMVDTTGDPWTYWERLAEFWGQGEDLVVIEQDIEITAETLPSFAACDQEWCSYGYQIYTPPCDIRVNWALGCVKFAASLQSRLDWNLVKHPWLGLDVEIARYLGFHFGMQPHDHGSVAHHHDYQGPTSFERKHFYKFGKVLPQPGIKDGAS